MKLLIQFAIISGICLACEAIVSVLPFSFPASVLALVVVLGFLMCKWLKSEQINTVSDFLLHNLPLLFLPVSVSVMNYWDVISANLFAFMFICIITVLLTYFATAYAVMLTIRLMNKGGKK